MTGSNRSKKWKLSVASSLAVAVAIATGNCALSQNITLDGSLGAAETLSGPDYLIPQAVGQTVDSNLFHSFEKFSIDAGESAGFQSAANIRNILLRVTGNSSSLIDGRIYTESASVNFFLINPNGIMFGPNASINVGGANRGSFIATTVDAITWSNGRQFSATNPGEPNSLLTIVGDPSGFVSSLRSTESITSLGSTLRVDEGQSLLLLGGNVSLDNSLLYIDGLIGGRISLAGVSGGGTVGLNVENNDLRLSFPDNVARADVSVTNNSAINVVAKDGGNISINAQNLNILGKSNLTAGITPDLGTVSSQAGDIEINTVGAATVAESNIFNSVQTGAVGNSGNINITGESLSVINGAQLTTSTFGQQGNAGNVNINARDTVLFKDSTAFSSVETLGAVGNGGNINITGSSLLAINGTQLVANTFGQGSTGNVNIITRDNVSFAGEGTNKVPSKVFSTLGSGAVGKGGDINIITGSISLTDGAQLVTSTFGRGDAGSVNINARDRVSFDGVSTNDFNTIASSTVGAEAIGNGGGINITAGSLSVTNGAYLISSTQAGGQGNAGSVNINVRDYVSFDGVGTNGFPSAALSAVEFEGIGSGDDLNIRAGSLSVTNGAYLSASTLGQGNAGSVNINARDSVSFKGASSNGLPSAAFSTVQDTAVGNGRGINITTRSLSLSDGAYLNASTRGQGDGGNITLNTHTLEAANGGQVLTTSRSNGTAGNITVSATDSITISSSDPTYFTRLAQRENLRVYEVSGEVLGLREQVDADAGPASGLFVSTFKNSTGRGGNLTIATGQLVVRDSAQVSASSEGTGTAGNLEVAARSIRLDNQAIFTSNTTAGQGNIFLSSKDLVLRRGSNITTNAAGTAIGGNITINTDVLVALENSDITADAEEAFGGQVIINAQGIFGTQFRESKTPQSDITATSELGTQFTGTVEINTPDIDPSSGLVSLPTIPIDTEVAQACTPGSSQANSKFVVTGRGGLPPTPTEALNPDAISVDWVTLQPESKNNYNAASSTSPTTLESKPIVEAQGWIINHKGEVVLTASAPTAKPHSSWQTLANCPS